jgi:hypothetical protein
MLGQRLHQWGGMLFTSPGDSPTRSSKRVWRLNGHRAGAVSDRLKGATADLCDGRAVCSSCFRSMLEFQMVVAYAGNNGCQFDVRCCGSVRQIRSLLRLSRSGRRRPDVVPRQCFEHRRCVTWMRTIIKVRAISRLPHRHARGSQVFPLHGTIIWFKPNDQFHFQERPAPSTLAFGPRARRGGRPGAVQVSLFRVMLHQDNLWDVFTILPCLFIAFIQRFAGVAI